MPVYQTKGHLTATIEAENIAAAQRYLLFNHDGVPLQMEQYLDPPLEGTVEMLQWILDGDGYNYTVTAVTNRELTEDEQKKLSSEVSGQNSDGLGEGFEQQEFAEIQGDPDCGCPWYINCGCGVYEDGGMISFDWEKNELPWTRIS